MTKLFVDDLRMPPGPEWVVAKTRDEAIDVLATRRVTHVSFDHDLGSCPECINDHLLDGPEGAEDDHGCDHCGTGYEVVTWLEEQIFNDPTFPVPIMTVHSDNGPGRIAINAAIGAIKRRAER